MVPARVGQRYPWQNFAPHLCCGTDEQDRPARDARQGSPAELRRRIEIDERRKVGGLSGGFLRGSRGAEKRVVATGEHNRRVERCFEGETGFGEGDRPALLGIRVGGGGR